MRGLQPHRVAEAPRCQLAFDGTQQIVDFFLLDEKIAVAGDAELVAAAHLHAGKQSRYERLDDRAQEHEMAVAQFVRQLDQARQGARRLHHGESTVAAEAILALDNDGEVQALVENLREGARRIQCKRAQYRFHLAREVLGNPAGLRRGPGLRFDEYDAALGQFGHEHIVQQLVLFIDQAHCIQSNRLQLFRHRQPIGAALDRPGLQQLFEAGHANLEKLIENRA